MRGRRRTVAAVLAEVLSARPKAREVAIVAAFAEACGPRLAREASCRGLLRDGRLLVVVADPAWAEQLRALEPEVVRKVNARLGRSATSGLDVRVGSPGR
jgi:predicted nucleic acid-binding Zn ribbon protein